MCGKRKFALKEIIKYMTRRLESTSARFKDSKENEKNLRLIRAKRKTTQESNLEVDRHGRDPEILGADNATVSVPNG